MSLADKISALLNAAPTTIDPEDEGLDDTRAQTVQAPTEELEFPQQQTPLRRKVAPLLLDEDERYAGEAVSRKRLADSDEDEAFGSDLSVVDDEEVSEEDESVADEEMSHEEDGASSEEEENSEAFEHMKTSDVPLEKKKGICTRNQINIWESILEMRIQLQKCLITANKMPQKRIFEELETEFGDKAKDVKGTVTDLLEKFLVLQSLLLAQCTETKILLAKGSSDDSKSERDGEEIPSDDEEIVSENEEDAACLHKAKRRKLEYYEENLANFHEKYQPHCNSVIQKWNDKTRILLSKGNEGASVLNQIQYALSDKAKLVKRTQLKRSNYQIIGEEGDEECNKEIFDDDDFYHQLLRELIEFRSADLTDPVQLSRQWIQLQNLRGKMKRNVDTRATKGRKIRYAVHSKLVNFMAPIDGGAWTEEAKTDLFKSLFRGDKST